MSISLAIGFFMISLPGLASAQDRRSGESVGWVGTGSCAATACHGGRREPYGLKGSEYSFSEAYDPHVRAYSILFEDRSLTIEKNLRRLKTVEDAKPHEDETCLRCHVYQGYSNDAAWTRDPQFTKADGVSCEGCHGPAANWLVPHTEASWKGLTDQQKFDDFGMRPTKDLLARGQACVECHVGQGSTDVNHDLIAAGHPRLNFEYSGHLGKYPKHWKVEDDKARNPDYEAKVYVLGQLITAKASLDLLESRAKRAIPGDSTSPWPELSEYSCFSCHHQLVKDGWPSANATGSAKRGTLQWGTWTLPMAQLLPSDLKGIDANDSISSLGSLRTLMTIPEPDPLTIAVRAHQASQELDKLEKQVNEGRIAPGEVRTLLAKSLKPDALNQLDWDGVARRYLAIVALDKAAVDYDPSAADPKVTQALMDQFKILNLPFAVKKKDSDELLTIDSPEPGFDPRKLKPDFGTNPSARPNP
jgi:hypothetical protein